MISPDDVIILITLNVLVAQGTLEVKVKLKNPHRYRTANYGYKQRGFLH